ncbi:MAG: hypothetical protein J4N84_14765 [Chloroflexi bacterium]|nr:hypothetical protein [Chloroflexota bacterium]
MPSAKEQLVRIVQEQPDDSSYDEILRELAFARMVDRGLADSQTGRTVSDKEMSRGIKTWRNWH